MLISFNWSKCVVIFFAFDYMQLDVSELFIPLFSKTLTSYVRCWLSLLWPKVSATNKEGESVSRLL